MLPTFIIIGAQRSASTFALRCLEEHPQVFMPSYEVRFFENPEYLQNDISQLEALFHGISPEKIIGIKRPDYLAKPECPERIYKHIPAAKLIVILRNPVERALSAYFHLMMHGFIPIRPVEEGLTSIINGEYKVSYPKSAEIIEYGLYHRHLSRYLNYFDRKKIFIVLFDVLKEKPVNSIRQIYRFIGVNSEYTSKSMEMKSRRNSSIYSLARLRLLTFRNRFIYTYYHNQTKCFLKKHPKLLDRLMNKALTWVDHRFLAPVCENSKPVLSPHLNKRLFEIYEEDIDGIENLLGRTLPSWKFNV
jgi:hypothetical protein